MSLGTCILLVEAIRNACSKEHTIHLYCGTTPIRPDHRICIDHRYALTMPCLFDMASYSLPMDSEGEGAMSRQRATLWNAAMLAWGRALKVGIFSGGHDLLLLIACHLWPKHRWWLCTFRGSLCAFRVTCMRQRKNDFVLLIWWFCATNMPLTCK